MAVLSPIPMPGRRPRRPSGAEDVAAVLQLKSQLQANQIEINNREQAIAALNAKINDYQARLNQEPVREQQLADLTRGYDQSKASYDDLLKKEKGSAMATSMELLQQGERFRVLDPPSLPLKPSFPNRLKFCWYGVLLGLALGLGSGGGVRKVDDRVYSEAELKKLLPVPVVSEIPVIADACRTESERKRIWLGFATAGLGIRHHPRGICLQLLERLTPARNVSNPSII